MQFWGGEGGGGGGGGGEICTTLPLILDLKLIVRVEMQYFHRTANASTAVLSQNWILIEHFPSNEFTLRKNYVCFGLDWFLFSLLT
jgi:hypothetical protein